MRRRLGLHVAALTVALVGLLLLTGTDAVVSADEGAMAAELDLLDRTGEWTLPNPEPVVDPQQRALPLELSERTVDGHWAPFAKHPAHIAALRPLWEVGGLGGALLLSIAGVVVAAVVAWSLAERLRPGAGGVAFWVAGLGSPLLFDGFQVVGHALGAGLFGLAVLLALRAAGDAPDGTEIAPASRRVAPLAGMAAALAVTGLVRSEGVLAGLAVAGAFAGLGLLHRRRPWVVVGAVAAVSTLAVRLGEPRLLRQVLGAESAGTVAPAVDKGGFLSGRWNGFRVTVLDVGYGVDSGEGLLLVALLLAVAAAVVWRLRGDAPTFRVLAGAAALAGLARMATAEFLVPGLLPALPVLAVALVLLRRPATLAPPRAALWGAMALYVAAVVATQYRTGGTGEWGGRYFALGLPVLVALAVVTTVEGTEGMDARTRRVGAVCLAVLTATVAVGAVRAATVARDAAGAVAEAVVAEVDGLDVDATVSTRGAVSRFAWRDVLDGRRWMTTTVDDLGPLLDRLAGDGATRVALVADSSGRALDELGGGGWDGGEGREVRPGTVVTLLTR